MRTRGIKRVVAVLEGVAVAYLMLLLALYGVGKLALSQFFTRLPWLDARVWQLGEFQFIWALYSQSAAYQFFAGLVETGVAALIFFKRSRKLGALLAVPVFLNLVSLNLGYDLGALDDALSGLIPATFLALLYVKDYKAFFWDEPGRQASETPPLFSRGVMRTGVVVKYVMTGLALVGTFLHLPLKYALMERPELFGRWQVESATSSGGVDGVPHDFAPGTFFYFDNGGDFAVRVQDSFRLGVYKADLENRQLELSVYNVGLRDHNELSLGHLSKDDYYNEKNLRAALRGSYTRTPEGTLIIEGTSHGARRDQLTVILRPEPL